MNTITAFAFFMVLIRHQVSGDNLVSIFCRHGLTSALSLAMLWCGVLPPISQAAIVPYNLTYSGAGFGNNATATGQISFDDTILPNGPVSLGNVSAATLGVTDWSLTVTGASTGNGVFSLADLQMVPGREDGWVWSLSNAIDLSTELVGQVGFDDFNWCAGYSSCGNPLAPGGIALFTIATNGETGDTLVLVSMAPVEPSPDFNGDGLITERRNRTKTQTWRTQNT